jgi:hypothetical protein
MRLMKMDLWEEVRIVGFGIPSESCLLCTEFVVPDRDEKLND